MKKKILNIDDNTVNPTAGVNSATDVADKDATAEESGTAVAEEQEDGEKAGENDGLLKDDEPYPGEIAFPDEQENSDEMA